MHFLGYCFVSVFSTQKKMFAYLYSICHTCRCYYLWFFLVIYFAYFGSRYKQCLQWVKQNFMVLIRAITVCCNCYYTKDSVLWNVILILIALWLHMCSLRKTIYQSTNSSRVSEHTSVWILWEITAEWYLILKVIS